MKTSINIHRVYRTAAVTLALVLAMLLPALPAAAMPVQGQFVNDPAQCDNVPDILLTHELGEAAVFPIDEQLQISVMPTNQVVCVGDDGIANDWDIRIVNVGNIAWMDLFFVADEGIDFSMGNWDGTISDLAFPGASNAFRIDAVGSNSNLVVESMASNGILEPGESWAFLVSNFGLSAPPVFDSVGVFSFSSPSGPPSTASILANPVPEPMTMSLLALGGLGVLKRRRRK